MKKPHDISEKEFLEQYRIEDYDRPSVTVDIAAFGFKEEEKEISYREDNKKTLSILLIKRGQHPYKNMWALPGGFVQRGEEIEKSAFRELKEETNVTPSSLMDIGTFSKPGRDPRGWIISNAFISVVNEDEVNQLGGDDAIEACWFNVEFEKKKNGEWNLILKNETVKIKAVLLEGKQHFGRTDFIIKESDGLAFDHAEIIATALVILKNKCSDVNVLFDFLPPSFTLTGLQRISEIVSGEELLKANFRRKILPLVEETGEYTSGAGHRPAKLFRKKYFKTI